MTGTFEKPVLAPDVAPLAGRVAAAIVLGLINPLAALFATIETGPGEDGSCPEMRRAIPGKSSGDAGRSARNQQGPIS